MWEGQGAGLNGKWAIRSNKWVCAEAGVASVNSEGHLDKRGFQKFGYTWSLQHGLGMNIYRTQATVPSLPVPHLHPSFSHVHRVPESAAVNS